MSEAADGVISVYVTAPSLEIAESISRSVVKEKLAACVNILPRAVSIYQWEGKLERQEEVVAFIKTTKRMYEKVEARICQLHPYDCPCIVVLEIEQGYEGFIKWVQTSTR